MCGFTGFFDPSADRKRDELRAIIARMAGTLQHRGPDDTGEWVDPSAGIALGFRRLSIIDLSPAGHQPMASASGRFVIAFNGEVYNFERIRAELVAGNLAPGFHGRSDTEVMLAAIEAWGLQSAVERFIGMFSFALWDHQEQKLQLVRDRIGIKPLYYGCCGTTFVFGSELKALRAHPGFSCEIDRDALTLYMRHGYVPGPHSIYEGIAKLPPGTILTVNSDAQKLAPERYWSAAQLAEGSVDNKYGGSEREATDELDKLLRDAISLRMIADVPLGVFLSGGIDSSTVTALMQVQSDRPVKTFSIGFSDAAYDEAHFAKEVARHLGTEHTELYVTPEQAMGVIPALPEIYDEPFADSSQIPTHLVSMLAREKVTVSLSGDGGDELFGGYPRYLLGRRGWKALSEIPAFLRRPCARLIRAIGPQRWEALFRSVRPILPSRLQQRHPEQKMMKFAKVLHAGTTDSMYREIVSIWPEPGRVVLGGQEPDTPISNPTDWLRVPEFTERMMVLDILTYLVDDILVKVDRASMAVGLEAREPLLDHRVVEFALQIPLGMKVRNGHGKWLLRQVLNRYVPDALIERPKAGFGMPIDRWLRGPLREWAEGLLTEKRLRAEGFFEPALVRNKWRHHLRGGAEQHPLWNVLMFEAWLEHQNRSDPAG